MRYILLVYRDEKMWEEMSSQQRVAAYEEAVEFSDELRKRGVYHGGNPLEHVSTATTVRMKHGKPVITDGPFAETKEALGGYSIVEAKDLDEMLEMVKRHPLVRAGLSIEVRPIREGPPR
ncbi:MAG TPA: YciI family protein [Verrucomicrobiae bacterium]|nr:YciI family protein [Verrucomicrobiae bacterium]